MHLDRIDHVVLTVADVARTVAFYERVLGMEHDETDGRHAVAFGRCKINLHQAGREFEPKALHPVPGGGDLCLITAGPLEEVVARLGAEGVAIEEGPVERSGALGAMTSVYVRDPDGNLIEISEYHSGED